jgi:hypothetical protein
MKLKLELGSELDINAAFDGGAVDTSVTYSVPVDQQDTISVTSAGVVEALAVGTAIVQVKDASGNLLRSIVVQVLSAADFAVQADLDSGTKELAVEFAAVSAPPSYTLITSQTAIGTIGYNGQGVENAFDSAEGSYWQSFTTFGDITQSYVGQQYASQKQVRKVRGLFATVPLNLEFIKSSDGVNWTVVDTVTVGLYANPENTAFNWLEWEVDAYAAATYFAVRPANATPIPGTYYGIQGAPTIDRFRVFELEFYE